MKRIFILVLLSFCFVNLGFAQQKNTIDSELYALMNSRSSDKISINIILKKPIDVNELNVRKSFSSKDAKRKHMVEEMKYQAEKNQADLMKTLQANERSSQVTDINCHWLTNMINCKATPDAILKIAEHPDVEAVIYNKLEKLIPDTKAKPASAVRGNTQNITQIGADQVWKDLGYTGEGVIVAVIDSGVNTEHVDLRDRLWNDGNGHHGINTLTGTYDLTDNDGHGTHCAGTICGDGTSGTATGMAPGATLMCIKALDVDYSDPDKPKTVGTVDATISAVEYAVQNNADVLSMSLGFSYPGVWVNEMMRELFSNTLELDVVAAVAAGNDGGTSDMYYYPVPRNINSPGNCPPPYLSKDQIKNEDGGKTSVICIGAVDYYDNACDFSSQGPVTWEKTSYLDYPYGTGIPTKTLVYDNGDLGYSLNFTNSFAVMYPPTMLAEFANGGILTSVSIFDGAETSGTFKVLEGGTSPTNGNQKHSQTFTLSATGDMLDIALNTTLKINTNANLWIVFELGTNFVPIASNTDYANGRWVKSNGAWGQNYISEMLAVRAKITTSNTSETHIGLIRPDVTAPGYQIYSTSNTSNNGFQYMSGTSMATPCAAGAMALLLEANPNLSPAQICQVLEETSVKLSTTKSNKTGTGRINIYDAVLAVADIELSAPTLTATAAGSSAINLSWTKSAGASSYKVYRAGSLIASNVTATSYTDSGLNAETSYCYQVKAVSATEESDFSNQDCATTSAEGTGTGKYRIKAVDRSATAGVSYYLNIENNTAHSGGAKGGVGLATKADDNKQIFEIETISGSNVYFKSATGYYIYCQQWNVDAYSTTTGTSLEMVDTGLGDNTFYISSAKGWFKVGKEDGGSNYYPYSDGNTSNREKWILEEITASTPDPTPTPTPPGDFTLTATAQSSSSIALSWTTSSNATSYDVYRAALKIATGLTTTSYTDTGLTANTQYCYSIVAVNTAGMTESNQACATTLTESSGGDGGDGNYEGEVTIGDGSKTNMRLPITTSSSYSYSQQIYTKAEIDPNGTLSGSNITKIAFKQSNTTTGSRNIVVYMQNTTEATFASKTAWIGVAGNKVFEGNVTLPGQDNYLEITLDTPLKYTGENVLISVYDATGSSISVTYFYTYTTGSRALRTTSNSSINPENMGTTNGNLDGTNNVIVLTFGSTGSTPDPDPTPDPEQPGDGGDECEIIVTLKDSYGDSWNGGYLTLNWDGLQEPEVLEHSSGPTSTYTLAIPQGANVTMQLYTGSYPNEIGFTVEYADGTVIQNLNTGTETSTSSFISYNFIVDCGASTPENLVLTANKSSYTVGENVILSWNQLTSTSLQGYNLYEKYWNAGNSSYTYEKINASLIPSTTTTYTIVGGLPTRGCDNTICLTAVYDDGETDKDQVSVTVAKTGYGTMAGVVVDESGDKLSGVSVTVRGTDCLGGTYTYTYTTGNDGKFGEGNMPMGEYTIYATKPGYNDRNIYGIEINHGEETAVEVEMWSRGDEYELEKEIGKNPESYTKPTPNVVLPISQGFYYSASQQIYTKEELDFTSATDVKITSISFRMFGNTNTNQGKDKVKVYVQNTDLTSFSSNSGWASYTDNDKVFDGEYNIPSDGEWMKLTFDNPFVYTGGNLLVTVLRSYNVWQNAGFYVYPTEDIRSLCGARDDYSPYGTSATILYKNNIIKLSYTTTSPEVIVNPNPIDFGEVIVGNYWREKPDATVPVQIKGYNTDINAVSVDNPFFTIPALVLPQSTANFDMAYNKNNAAGLKSGTLSVTPKKGNVKEVNVTATAYDPVEPDIFEKSREVVWVNDEYEDTPDFTTLHDDYIMPSEAVDGTRNDAVYKLTLERDAYVTAMIYNGKNALLAFYKDDFANDTVDKDGPSGDNPYYGIGGAPTVETIDVHILCHDDTLAERKDLTIPQLGLTIKSGAADADDKRNWSLNDLGGFEGRPWEEEDDTKHKISDQRALYSLSYTSKKLKPENYIYTTAKYEITAMSEITFAHIYTDHGYYQDIFDVVVSKDGENFTSVYTVEYGEGENQYKRLDNDKWHTSTVSLALPGYIGEKVHIGFMHKDQRDFDDCGGVKIDDICIKNVLKTDDSRSKSEVKPSTRASGQVTAMRENMLFPRGTYYAVPAAETEFTFYLTKQDIDEGIIFIRNGDWKEPDNWNIQSVPEADDDVIIRANAHVTNDVKINSIYIESQATLTIEDGGVLEVTEGIENKLHSAFIIEDGGQLYQNAANVAATFNMDINNPGSWGPDGNNHANGWQFIASPFVDADLLSYVNPDKGGDYDLYKYDGTRELEWVNYKLHHDEFIHDFADGMQGWNVVDANGDGYTWSYNGGAGHDSVAGYLSCVFYKGASNDYLVSPKIINTYPESKLRFWIKNDNVTTSSEVEVWLSDKATKPTTENDFDTIVGTVTVTSEWQQVEFLLEDYADQDDRDLREYWMAIRCTSGASANTEVMIDQLELANYEEANPYETEFVLGRGYIASYEKDGEASLQGVLNHERTFTYKVAYNDADRWENFYLIGNPFPYNISWSDFTFTNIVKGYAVVDDDGTWKHYVSGDIKVGDGLMILTTSASPSISVEKRRSRNAVADYLDVVASGADGDDNFIISLSGDEKEGFKKLENFNKDIAQIYVSEYGTHYGIVNRDADVEEVEFFFEANKMGRYTISVTPNGDFTRVSLYDRVEDVETDMLSGDGYNFFAQGTKDNRFVLRFAKGLDKEEGFFVYQSGDELVIDAEGLVQIIDVMGRVIYSGEQSGINRVNVSGFENSACVVRNMNSNEVRTQKIVIL